MRAVRIHVLLSRRIEVGDDVVIGEVRWHEVEPNGLDGGLPPGRHRIRVRSRLRRNEGDLRAVVPVRRPDSANGPSPDGEETVRLVLTGCAEHQLDGLDHSVMPRVPRRD